MPSLGADMEAGTLVQWNRKVGDPVKRGDVLAVVETQKGLIDVDVLDEGILQRIDIAPGTKVPVGTRMALIGPEAVVGPSEAPRAAPAALPPPEGRVDHLEAPLRVRATPAARRRARELGIVLDARMASGAQGVVYREDVAQAGQGEGRRMEPLPVPTPPVSPLPSTLSMRAAIGAAMARSKREIPHYSVGEELDVTKATVWLRERNEGLPLAERLLLVALLLRATALAARDYPEMNGHFVEGRHCPSTAVHLGLVVSMRGGGLVVPCLHDASQKDVHALMLDLNGAVLRAREGRLRGTDLADATLTVTNLGDQGSRSVTGVVYPPQVAIVGFGRAQECAWAEGGMLGVRQVITATLAADHRVSDGLRGAMFLRRLGSYLQAPERWMMHES